MTEAFLCDAIRTPIGRYGGALSGVRADDLGAVPLKALVERNRDVDWTAIDDVIYGCANQAGEDNRNVARMSALLAGLPQGVPGSTINRLCGSGMDAVGVAARAIKSGEAALMVAGGVESMTRAPFVMGKAASAFARADIYDTTIGWRFVNPLMKQLHGVDSMPETAETSRSTTTSAEPRTCSRCAASRRPRAHSRTARSPRKSSRSRLRRRRAIRWSCRATSIRARRRSKRWRS